MQYVYEVSGYSLTGEKKAKLWARKKREFKMRVFGSNLNDVLSKAQQQELEQPITHSIYHNDIEIFPITEVFIEHASLITTVECY